MERFERGLKVLRRTLSLQLQMADNLLEQEGFLAGSDSMRLGALHRAFSDPDASAIFCARGGYGATRLLGTLDPERLRRHPKLLVGFSDITALLCWAYVRAGLRGIHGPVVTQMSTLHPEEMTRLVDLLTGQVPAPLQSQEGTVVGGGTVEGELIVGNLEVLRALVGTRYFPELQGKILAIEDVGERPYRLDRTLTQLLSSGVLRGVRGIVVGQLVGCDGPEGLGPTALEVVVERLGSLGVPLATGFEFGHDDHHNAALPFGARVRLHADECTLEFLEPVTE
jgi:muramoyltetrapeptide carboxypeptidase